MIRVSRLFVGCVLNLTKNQSAKLIPPRKPAGVKNKLLFSLTTCSCNIELHKRRNSPAHMVIIEKFDSPKLIRGKRSRTQPAFWYFWCAAGEIHLCRKCDILISPYIVESVSSETKGYWPGVLCFMCVRAARCKIYPPHRTHHILQLCDDENEENQLEAENDLTRPISLSSGARRTNKACNC